MTVQQLAKKQNSLQTFACKPVDIQSLCSKKKNKKTMRELICHFEKVMNSTYTAHINELIKIAAPRNAQKIVMLASRFGIFIEFVFSRRFGICIPYIPLKLLLCAFLMKILSIQTFFQIKDSLYMLAASLFGLSHTPNASLCNISASLFYSHCICWNPSRILSYCINLFLFIQHAEFK